MIPWSRKSITATNPRSAYPPGSPNCQFLLRQLLSHSYALDSPSSKFQIMPSQTHDLHKPLRAAEFASTCRLLMSAPSNSATTSILVSLSPWRVFLPGLDIPSSSPCSSTICAADFPLTNHSCTNLHCRFIPLLARLPAPLCTVLDSLSKCAPLAHLTLLHREWNKKWRFVE